MRKDEVNLDCIYCKSSNVIKNVIITGGNHMHPTGIVYTERKIWTKTEPIIGEVCKDCGSIRLYVQNTNRNWKQHK